jgi:hypothetical protein
MVRERMRHFVLLVSLLATVAVIAGCDGSDSSGSATSGSSNASSDSSGATETTDSPSGGESEGESGGALTKSEFIAQADDICSRIQEETVPLENRYSQLGKSARSPADLKELAGVVRELLGYAGKGIGEVQGLEEPATDTEAIDEYAAVIEKRIATGKEFASALESNNQSEANSLIKENGDIGKEAEGLAKNYGFKVCGSSK